MNPLKWLGRFPHSRRDVVRALVVLAIGGPLVIGGIGAATFFLLPLPTVVPAPRPGALAQTSRIYAPDGSLIAALHAEYNRELIRLSDIPDHLEDATVAAEDARFFRHSGIDTRAILRALWADLRAGSAVQGGSTITQQYVKNAYIDKPRRTIFRKVREALYAAQIERSLSKSKILENYLNTVYFGRGAYGVQAAAKSYFNKNAKDLSVSESAQLVGLISSPNRNSPYTQPERAEVRRIFVLERMLRHGYLDQPTADAAAVEKPAFAKPREEVFKYPWFVDAVKRYLIAKYGYDKVFNGGLRVTATIDPRMQEAAEKIISETLDREGDPHAALVSIDPKTGYVQALVGGRKYEDEKFNIAMQGRRQPGSAFKPFVLVAALEDGISTRASYNGPGKFCGIKGYRSKDGCVHNFNNRGFGRITLEKATINSVNTVYIQLARDVGVDKIIRVSKKMGISTTSLEKDEENLAIALGGFTLGVTPLEMASAYATLAAGGEYRTPKFVSEVIDGEGKLLERGPAEPVRAISPAVASKTTEILKKVITSGTAKRANIGRPAAGKTGTAQDYRNAWFVGYTPDASTAVWMGYREKNRPLRNVHGVKQVTGGTLPAQIWGDYMKLALAEVSASEFGKPGKEDSGFKLPYKPSPTPSPSPTEDAPTPTPSPSPSPAPSGLPPLPGASPSPSPSAKPPDQ